MDLPLVNDSSFSAAHPAAYSLAEIWPFSGEPGSGGFGIRVGNLGRSVETHESMEESTVTDQSGARKRKEGSSEMVSTSSADDLVGFTL